MLTQKQLEEIKEHLEKAQNPVFFFDNDVDGLCSFLILQRGIGRGKGVAVRSYPGLNSSYLRKIDELNADYVFIVDKPVVDREFFEGVFERNVPVIWIDHHEVQVDEDVLKNVEYYNSFPSSEPVTYIAYNVFKKQEDMWLGMIGCIGDVYMPDFAKKFGKENPDLFNSKLNAFDSFYMSEIGRAVGMLNFGLKDTTTNVVRLMKFLINAKGVYDIFEENRFTQQLHKRYGELRGIYDKLMEKAENCVDRDLVFFTYSGEVSMSSEVSNGLYFNHKDKTIVVVYKSQDKANISIRGNRAKEFTLKAIEGIENSRGGGHEKACGAQVPIDSLDEFKGRMVGFVNG